jgi:Icc-related predicted phosphoesterase
MVGKCCPNSKNNIEIIKKWVNGRDLLFTLGNHDFINPVEMEIILNENKIKAYDLNNKLITYNNINFYGFPYISYINGHFNYELDLADMNELFNNVLNVLNTSYVDVLAFHSPIYGILDLEFNTNYGSSIIFDKLKYSLDNDKIPIFYLHGHVHHYHGFDRLNIGNNILTISNAATTNHIINI